MMIPSKILIRGTQVAYYVICKTKLWLFSHMISMEHTSDLVREGSLIHETYYAKEKKEVNIDNEISLDIIKTKDGVEIREIKKSPKMEKAHVLQIQYYMYYLKKKGIPVKKGVILYPQQKKSKIIENIDDKNIKKVIKDIKEIVTRDEPPTPIYKSYCKKCSYYEFCFG